MLLGKKVNALLEGREKTIIIMMFKNTHTPWKHETVQKVHYRHGEEKHKIKVTVHTKQTIKVVKCSNLHNYKQKKFSVSS